MSTHYFLSAMQGIFIDIILAQSLYQFSEGYYYHHSSLLEKRG